jgi:hypothetical protein
VPPRPLASAPANSESDSRADRLSEATVTVVRHDSAWGGVPVGFMFLLSFLRPPVPPASGTGTSVPPAAARRRPGGRGGRSGCTPEPVDSEPE